MSVNVLCPNGRRVVVKITPNTSILQIIEDACKKYDFNPDSYDLKHLRRVLDTSNTVRYANLPNNSQLELVEAVTPRVASNVTVNIATESGLRLFHEFPPSTLLCDIVQHFSDTVGSLTNEVSLVPAAGHEAVVVYMMRRVAGKHLNTTTLKSLGLTRGKCMFRYSTQVISDGPDSQPHVSSPLVRASNSVSKTPHQMSPSTGAIRKGSRPSQQQPDITYQQNDGAVPGPSSAPSYNCPQPDSTQQPSNLGFNPQPEIAHPASTSSPNIPPFPALPDLNIDSQCVGRANPPPNVIPFNEQGSIEPRLRPNLIPDQGPDIVSSSQSPGVPDVVQSQTHPEQPDIVGDSEKGSNQLDLVAGHHMVEGSLPTPPEIVSSQECMDVDSSLEPEIIDSTHPPEDAVVYIGDHDAILFSMQDAPAVPMSDEDDSFYELSVLEVKKLYQEYQRTLKELENQPLMTKGMREMDKQGKILSVLNQYPVAQLRICFPDSNVIQASFKPHDSIRTVMDFLRPFLVQPEMDFSLYSNYPRTRLKPETSLVEADCAPKARVYFATPEPLPAYINDDTMAKKSSFSCANSAVIKSAKSKDSIAKRQGLSTLSTPTPLQGSSSSNTSNHETNTSRPIRLIEGAKKKPKWFKLGK